MGRPALDPEQKFWSNVTPADPDQCWPWKGAVNSWGYGDIHLVRTAERQAHRFAYRLLKGPIPAGMHVLHACDNPRCCNPSHLSLGTHADNMADKAKKGRSSLRARNGNAKLTEDQFREVRERAATGEDAVSIARDMGVWPSTISAYLRRERARAAR